MADINEKLALWYGQFVIYKPSWNMDDFKTNMNLLELNVWHPALDESLTFQLEEYKKILKKQMWYEKFHMYNNELTFESFIEKHELEHWDHSTDMKLEFLLTRAKTNHTFIKTNEWLKKFQQFNSELTRAEFVNSHNIVINSVWNDELEARIQLAYKVECDTERMRWYDNFAKMWPTLFEEKFLKLFDSETDMNATHINANINPKLFCKLMDIVYERNLDCSYNLMIHKLDITIEHPCDNVLEEKLKNYFENII